MSSNVLALVLSLMAVIFLAEVPAGQQQTGASRVALASVTDPRNKPLVDVSADDFVIQEAGAAREILSVRPADYPIVVLLDTGSEARADFPLMQKAAAHFIERIGQRPIALGTFGGTPKMLTTFEDERQTVLAKLGTLAAEPSAGSLLLRRRGARRRRRFTRPARCSPAIVILSATAADASQDPADEMIAPVIDSNAILHVIANRPGQTAAGGSAIEPGAARAGRAVARRLHGDLLGRVVSGRARSPGGSADERDADRVSRPGRVEAE